MSGLGLLIFGMIRAHSSELYPATLFMRVYFIACIVAFYAMTGDPLFLDPRSITFARVKAHFRKRMDCRVKPGNDGSWLSAWGGAKTKRRPRNVARLAQISSTQYAKVTMLS